MPGVGRSVNQSVLTYKRKSSEHSTSPVCPFLLLDLRWFTSMKPPLKLWSVSLQISACSWYGGIPHARQEQKEWGISSARAAGITSSTCNAASPVLCNWDKPSCTMHLEGSKQFLQVWSCGQEAGLGGLELEQGGKLRTRWRVHT